MKSVLSVGLLLSALVAIATALQFQNIESYSDPECTKLVTVTSNVIQNCSALPQNLFNGTCVKLPVIENSLVKLPQLYGKQSCGDQTTPGAWGYVSEFYENDDPFDYEGPCNGNLTMKIFVIDGWCVSAAGQSTRVKCGGSDTDSSVSSTRCQSADCSGSCVTMSAGGFSKNKCRGSLSMYCGMSAASALVVPFATVALAVFSVLFW